MSTVDDLFSSFYQNNEKGKKVPLDINCPNGVKKCINSIESMNKDEQRLSQKRRKGSDKEGKETNEKGLDKCDSLIGNGTKSKALSPCSDEHGDINYSKSEEPPKKKKSKLKKIEKSINEVGEKLLNSESFIDDGKSESYYSENKKIVTSSFVNDLELPLETHSNEDKCILGKNEILKKSDEKGANELTDENLSEEHMVTKSIDDHDVGETIAIPDENDFDSDAFDFEGVVDDVDVDEINYLDEKSVIDSESIILEMGKRHMCPENKVSDSDKTVIDNVAIKSSVLRKKQMSECEENYVVIERYNSDVNCVHECAMPYSYFMKKKGKLSKNISDGKIVNNSVENSNSEIINQNSLNIENSNNNCFRDGKKFAKEYKYKLDPFQYKSIECLENGESLLLSAHTSAGKTCVAEYAIAVSIRDKQKVIYTSPIKALSNQKYRDLSEEFKDVGIMTGDVTLNPNSSLIVMTTEILRNMLYRGGKLLTEVKWVIFDEIHYLRDRDRGVVWEEAIILLPPDINIVFLSATIPNAIEFASWIATIKQRPFHVIYTDFRPTPLQHFMFPAGGDGVFLVMDENKQFKHNNFQLAIKNLNHDLLDVHGNRQTSKKNKLRSKSDIEKIVQMCYQREYTPVIVFSFSKKDCEANAAALKKTDFTDDNEKSLVDEVFLNAIATLAEEDRNLPQVRFMHPLLRRGIGIHHGGLLPLVKEVVEILFQESLIKVLFSTETLSMGINMPAKTVVFTSLRKWDGVEYRLINSGEFIQMAGRAGRRGLDDRGITILMLDEQVEPEDAKKIFTGEALRLDSQFKLGYNMILNLFKIEDFNPIYMLQRSFCQFQKDRKIAGLQIEKKKLESRIISISDIRKAVLFDSEKNSQTIVEPDCDVNKYIAKYYESMHYKDKLSEEVQEAISSNTNILKFLQCGRLIEIQQKKSNYWNWGICCQLRKESFEGIRKFNNYRSYLPYDDKDDKTLTELQSLYVVDVLVRIDIDIIRKLVFQSDDETHQKHIIMQNLKLMKPYNNDSEKSIDVENELNHGEKFIWEILPFSIHCIRNISKILMNMPNVTNLVSNTAKVNSGNQFSIIEKKFEGTFPVLDPVVHLNIADPKLIKILENLQKTEASLNQNPLLNHPCLPLYYKKYDELMSAKTTLRNMDDEISSSKHLTMKNQLKNMRRVLKKLNYLDKNDVATIKGRIACEISTCDELVLSELVCQNVFEDINIDYICAILSCMVFDDIVSEESTTTDPILLSGYNKIREVARSIAKVSVECGLSVSIEDYVNKFKPDLMDIVLKWMRGASFADLLSSTSIFEGSIIRSMRRLEELLRQLCATFRTIENEKLEKTFMESICTLKRGIVFAASLYL